MLGRQIGSLTRGIGEASSLGVFIFATGSLVDQKIEKGFPPVGYLGSAAESVGGIDVVV